MFDYGTLRELWWLLLGVLLIGLMYLMPTGVMGGLHRVWSRLRAKSAG